MVYFQDNVGFLWQVDVELAKQNANKPEDDEDLRKKLWLKIGWSSFGPALPLTQ